jgi:colanic acid/amylovoran biosynthesis glycosyltransferase
MRQLRVAYLLLHFPFLTETFVAQEVKAVRDLGVDVQIVSLLEPDPRPVQQLSQELLAYCWYAPGLASPALWWAQLYFLITAGGRYLALLWRLLRCPYPNQPFTLFAKRLAIFFKAAAVAYKLRNSEVDLFHTHFAWLSGAAAWVCARLLEKPFTVTAHAYDIFAANDLLPLVAGEASQVVAISEFNRQYIAQSGARSPEEISVIRCGVDLAAIKASANGAKPPQPGGPVRILAVGSLNLKKGHRYLIEACRLLKERGLPFTCTIIGDGGDEATLRALIRQWDLAEMVTLRGAIPNHEIMQAYREHDIFALASVVAPNGDRDGIPVVMMEAGAMGLPLVSTQVAGIPELVQNGRTGLIAPPQDPAALADALATLAANPEQRQRYGAAAKTLVEAEYGIASNAQRLVELFRRLTQAPSQTSG